MEKKINIVIVCGPTASGKTSLGVSIASNFMGEIISADSRQVYRSMNIGTGKDLFEYTTDTQEIPYHLIDIADPAEVYTLYDYKRDFKNAYEEICGRKKVPIIVGGTGLYIEAVLRNFDIPAIPEDPGYRSELMNKEKSWLKKELYKCAIDLYEKTDLSSKKRIVRALEVAMHRKNTIDRCDLQFPDLNPLILCTRWDRQELRNRIDARLNERLEQGMVEEVKRLLESGITRSRFSLFGMEYKHIARYLDGEVNYEKMVDDLKTAIHQLAKRQNTWFRGMERRGSMIHWIDNANKETALSIIKQSFDM